MEEEQERPQPMAAISVPHFTNEPQCLVLLNGAPPSMQLNVSMLSLIPNFHGLTQDDPFDDLKLYVEAISTITHPTIDQDQIKIKSR
ncbi:hypothetical protein ACFX13_033464 [Malus domestica]